MPSLEQIDTANAPAAVGPYSQAIAVGDLIFTSGSLPLNPADKTMPADIKDATRQSLTNLKAILEQAGSSMEKVVKATVFLVDINDFAAMNEVYATFFTKPYPARSCYAVAALPMGAKVEIELIASK